MGEADVSEFEDSLVSSLHGEFQASWGHIMRACGAGRTMIYLTAELCRKLTGMIVHRWETEIGLSHGLKPWLRAGLDSRQLYIA